MNQQMKDATAKQQGPTLGDLVRAQILVDTYLLDDKGSNDKFRAALLSIQIQQSGGGYLTKSNLWTFFGGPKLYHSGTASPSLSYLLIQVQYSTSGAVPVYGGYVKSGNVRNAVNKLMESHAVKAKNEGSEEKAR